jgi:hypothetical protein
MLFTTGCFDLQIQNDVDYPDHLFKKAWSQIESIHKAFPKRQGDVSKLCILVYEGDDRQLIRFSVPYALVEWGLEQADNDHRSRTHKHTEKYLDFDLDSIKNLDRVGPGLLVEVNDEDSGTHVLIWME